jgi:hypothetical protein
MLFCNNPNTMYDIRSMPPYEGFFKIGLKNPQMGVLQLKK